MRALPRRLLVGRVTGIRMGPRLTTGMKEPEKYALSEFFGEQHHELLSHVPHCAYVGLQVVKTEPCAATLKMPYRDDLVGDPARGVVFGGVITTLLDQACGLAVGCALVELQAIATLDLRIDYLRTATPGLDLIGWAECYKLTKNVAFVRGLADDGDRDDPFASCLATFMIGANPLQSPFAARLADTRKHCRTDEKDEKDQP